MYRYLVLFLFASLFGCPVAMGEGNSPPVSEAAVKAASVYNFSKFVEWPEESQGHQSPLRICLYGSRDSFLAALAEIEGRTAQGRQIKVQKVNLSEFRGCNILAIGEGEQRQLPEILRNAQEANALTVAELEGFILKTAVTQFHWH